MNILLSYAEYIILKLKGGHRYICGLKKLIILKNITKSFIKITKVI